MVITVYSIAMALVCGSILVSIMLIIRKRHLFSKKIGFQCMLMLYFFCGLRMLLPISFSFTNGVDLRGSYAQFFEIAYWKKYMICGRDISVSDMLLYIWTGGGCVTLFRFIWQYRRMIHFFSLAACENNILNKVLERVSNTLGKSTDVIIKSNGITKIPLSIGMKQQMIILPDRNYSEDELYYILLHECTHFLNHDLWIKMVTHIFCCILWWNPLVYFLQKDISQTLEMRCDICVTSAMSNKESAEYLQVIVDTLKNVEKNDLGMKLFGAAALATNQKNEMIERFQVVLNSKHKKQKEKHMWLLAVFGLFILSYIIIPRGAYDPSIAEIESDQNILEMTSDNGYILHDVDRKYYPVVNGVKLDSISQNATEILLEDNYKLIEREKKNEN